MNVYFIKLCVLLPLLKNVVMQINRVKLKYEKGIVCNMESFQSVTHRVVNRYFCTTSTKCRPGPHHVPVIPKDLCNDYYEPENGDKLICCHQNDFVETVDKSWINSYLFLPSFRSYIMCRHYNHLLCGEDGRNHCETKSTTTTTTSYTDARGIPQIVEQFPHTALVGYATNPENTTFHWFCMGSVVSERAVITASKCYYFFDKLSGSKRVSYSTHVRVGESLICDYCKDRQGEQTIAIKRWERHPTQDNNIEFIILERNIVFNKKVRPACFLTQPSQPSSAWYVHYGKPEQFISTHKGDWPVYLLTKNPNYITFKVKAKHNALIYLAETGVPSTRDNYWTINLSNFSRRNPGQAWTNKLSLSKTGFELYRHHWDSLNEDQFRGFWIRAKNGDFTFGKEDEVRPLLARYAKGRCCEGNFTINVVGFSTPTTSGEWIISDYEGLFSLHGSGVDVLWGGNCSKYHPSSFTPVDQYVKQWGDRAFVGEEQLCAGNLHTGLAPCQYDWGSTVQTTDPALPCMWQLFGIYAEDEIRNCSNVNSPALFVNFANHLSYIETNAYPWFSRDWFHLKTHQPPCFKPPANLTGPGRCPDATP